jgi:hypothetical protein
VGSDFSNLSLPVLPSMLTVRVFLTLTVSILKRNNPKAIYRNFSVNRLFLEATMGFEPMMRVLQFCTVVSANKNLLQTAVSLLLDCSCTASPCKNPEKFSKNGLLSGTSSPF